MKAVTIHKEILLRTSFVFLLYQGLAKSGKPLFFVKNEFQRKRPETGLQVVLD